MSNPFDQFAVDVQAALPAAPPGGPDANGTGNPFSTVFVDAPPPQPSPGAPKPVMNSPPMAMGAPGGMYGQPPSQQQQQQQPLSAMGGMMNVQYGQSPPPGPYGQQPPPPPPPQQMEQQRAPSMYGSLEMPVGYQPENPSYALSLSPPASSMAPTTDPYGSGAFGMQSGPAPAPASTMNDPFAAYGAPPPASGPPAAPTASPNPYGAPPPQQPSSAGGAAAPYGQQHPNPYGAPPAPFATITAPPPANDPFGGYGMQPPAAPVPPPTSNSYGATAGAMVPPANDPFGGYGMPPAAPPQPPAASPNPYGAPPAALPPSQPPQQQQAMTPYGDPFGADPGLGALVPSQQHQQAYPGAPPPQALPANDPFAVFNSAPAPSPQPATMPAHAPAPHSDALVPATAPPPSGGGGDLWGDLGFDTPPDGGVPAVVGGGASVQEEKKESGELPPGGEFYDARIFTPTLGVMFFKPQELTDSLFLNTDRSIVDGLAERPVVAFIVEGSSARSAGVELGHVLLKVNGVDVKNPKEASRLIKEGPRPLPLMFYVPNTDVVVAEGEHMVKYDTRETTAPNSAKDWKPKYVVIGGIIAQPWMMNMYRSKSEYDIAVIETQARRPVSVKVKQFSLQGARIQNDWQGPQMVKYKNKLHPWKYIVVLPVARNPIKISSPNLAQLKPVHEGIRRVLLAQQRSRGGNPHSAGPVGGRDPYSGQNYNRGGSGGPPVGGESNRGGGQSQQYPPQQQQQQYPQNAGYAQPSGYTGGY
jgi:PDZ domain